MATCQERAAALGACQEAVVWLEGRDGPLAWELCERGDWMLWVVEHCPSITEDQKQEIGKEILLRLIDELPPSDRSPLRNLAQNRNPKSSAALSLKQQLAARGVSNRQEKHLLRAMITGVEQKGKLARSSSHDTLVELGFHYCYYWQQKDGGEKTEQVALRKKELADLVRSVIPTIPVELT